ncbi:MAG: hypothetical protein Q4F21_12515 [Lachnospiraceae bacterium]|nr:hypothetical protein [Lachnospiraceae bacterium]
MKKTILFLLMLSLIIFPTTSVSAQTSSSQTEYEYFEDGSYFVTTTEEITLSDVSVLAATNTKTGRKKSTYYNNSGEPMWFVQVTGTFSYGNGTSTCTASSVAAESSASTWKITNRSAGKSGNKATATAKQYMLGLPINTVNRTVTLTCSSTGVLS